MKLQFYKGEKGLPEREIHLSVVTQLVSGRAGLELRSYDS